MQRSPMVVVSRGRVASAATRVLEELRGVGPLSRDELARATGLSPATIARAVTSLVGSGLVRERRDLVPSGVVGRPRTPVEVDPTTYAVVGIHQGVLETTVALCDLAGRVIASESRPHRHGAPVDLDQIARLAADLLADDPRRVPLGAGFVAPWRDLGLDPAATAAELQEVLGLDVVAADHIAAVAAAEYIHRRHGLGGVTTYLYARNSAGFVMAVDRGIQTEVSRVASLTHFPSGTDRACHCGHAGCFAASAGDQATAQEAYAAGLVAGPRIEEVYLAASGGSEQATALLRRRARLLGRVAATVRDMVNPDRLILVGQAFTDYPPVLDDVLSSFAETTRLPALTPTFTRFGAGIQAVAAGTIALGPVYDDPLGVVPRRAPAADRCQQVTARPEHVIA
ncbi:ROK family transcriptional regulator [Nocardioides mangrovi]|uniref:ROK family transcriptional regulator n=1 Tax=Nocardioides mangrovi TaxID=2874580 RepID=A0ABS7UE36_9ACTN|nr:ROK family transcriptional regulator [Nocardioides mangrovi]MBZ5739125.1 ROK family transcriptional regulator [Nocardioides mangrovi]